MTWFRLDDGFHSHPKVLRAGNEAIGLFVRCGTYAAQHLTDGVIPEHIVLLYGSEQLADKLVKAGLWRRTRGGWRMPDYLDYNPSKEAVDNDRRSNAQRQKRWREGQRNAVSNGPSNGVTNSAPSRPVPSRRDGGSVVDQSSVGDARANDDDDQEVIQTIISVLHEETGRAVTPDWAERVRRQILGGRHVTDPAKYAAACIRGKAEQYLPSDSDPSSRTVAEALAAARGEPT